MLAFMSGTVGPVEQAHWRNLGNGSVPQWELQRQALREAERVLAEAQPVTRFGWRLSLSDLRHIARLDVGDAKQSFETDSGRDALAESLSAVLPVLDELADNAFAETTASMWNSTTAAEYDSLSRSFRRNRATLAGMDGHAPCADCGMCGHCGPQAHTMAHLAAMEAGK